MTFIDISIVIPAFNEAESLRPLLELLTGALVAYGSYEIVVVDDGSTDDTFAVLHAAAAQDTAIRFVRLSRNFGHQAALRAGLRNARGRIVISMDADLQHPISMIPEMVDHWRSGYEVVTTSRIDPPGAPILKRISSWSYYRILSWLSGVRIEPGSADFRLLDRKVADVINELPERELFFRTLVPWLGFRSINIKYVAAQRQQGQSKYTWRKMISLALLGVVANSVTPLRLSIFLALILSGLTLAYGAYAFYAYFFAGDVIPGWASVIISVNMIGSLQLIVLGVIGEYLGRVLNEIRRRPGYIIAQTNCDPESDTIGRISERPVGTASIKQDRA